MVHNSAQTVKSLLFKLCQALEDQAEVSMTLGKGIAADEDTTLLEQELEELMRAEEELKPSPLPAKVLLDDSASDVLGELNKLTLEGKDKANPHNSILNACV